jgi:pyruvate,orthophosphate dikinase
MPVKAPVKTAAKRYLAKTPSKSRNGQPKTAKKTKMVYYFGGGRADGDGKMKPLLGGKGANLAEMTRIGLPVPPGFTITTEVCTGYYAQGRKLPQGLIEEVQQNIA